MDLIWEGIREAFWLLIHNEGDVYEIAWRTIRVSGTATLIALVMGVGLGSVVAFKRFPGRLGVMTLVNTGMGLPPVVVGLMVAIVLWRSGPLGQLNWIYTPKAMIIAQTMIATPVIIGFTAASLASLPAKLQLQVYALGASRWQMLWTLLQEVRLPLLAAVMAGFGAAISEVGASVMVGGNIQGETRVLTGAVLLEQSRGDFGTAIALGLILMAMMLTVNGIFTWVQLGQQRGARRTEVAPTQPLSTPWPQR